MKARLKLTMNFPEGSSLSVMSQPLRRGSPEMAEFFIETFKWCQAMFNRNPVIELVPEQGLASGAAESYN